jgi:C4-dicarboxylate transporter, DctQ subunit
MNRFNRALDRLLNIFAAAASVLLIAMMLATVVKVGLRSAANHGILGIDQISGTMMVYITFLGAAWVLRRDGHVTVEIFVSSLRPDASRLVQMSASIIAAAACLAIAWFSTQTVLLSLERGVVVAAELEIPRAVNLAVIPLGFLLLGIEFVRRLVRLYRGESASVDRSRIEA